MSRGNRWVYGAACLAAAALGLASRRYAAALPPWLAAHAGDALWAAMIYFGWRLLLSGRPPWLAALTGLGFCFAVEASQLYQADWINGIRATRLGGLALGRGFLAADLLRYAAGTALAWLADRLLLAGRLRRR